MFKWLKKLFDDPLPDGSNGGLAGLFNKQNYINTFSGAFGDDYNEDKGIIENLFGSSLGDMLKALTNRLTGAHLTGAEREANEFTAGQAELNRDFEERMASTQYQRTVSDMRSAGINPALAIGNSVNAAPAGVSASSVNPSQAGFGFSDLMQLLMLPTQKSLMKSQIYGAFSAANAARENALTNKFNAETDRINARTREREADISQSLADNQIKIGDTVVELNRTTMAKLQQDIQESASRIDLQDMEYAAKLLKFNFDTDMYETNKQLLIQQLAYRAVEMSEMSSVIKLNNELTENAKKSGQILDDEKVAADLSAEWKSQNPRLYKAMEAIDMGTSAIGNILRGSVSASFGRSTSKSDVSVDSRSYNVSRREK